MPLATLLCFSAAGWTASAGIIHFVASTLPDHHADPRLLAFFLATGVIQVGCALATVRRPSPTLLVSGAALNLGIAAVWVVSRTVGIPFVNGGAPESVGFGDVASTLFEVGAAACVALVTALPAAAAEAVLRRGGVLFGGAVAAALAMLLPSVVTLPADMGSGGQMPAAKMASAHQAASGSGSMPMRSAGSTATSRATSTMSMPAAGALRSLGQQVSIGMTVMSNDSSGPYTMPATMRMGPSQGATAVPARSTVRPAPLPFWGQRTVVRYGPIALPPNSMGGGLHNLVSPAFPKPCSNCLMTGVIPDMVYADGSPANIDTGVMLHHVVIFDNSKDDYTCPRWDGVGALGRRIFASGNERTAMSMPPGFGLPVGDEWAGLFDLMNMTSQVRSVFLQFTVYHVPTGTAGVHSVVPVWLDENNCGNSEFSVPAGRTDRIWRWTSNLTGRVVLAGGHLHNGGVSITLTNLQGRERICTAVADYGTKPHYAGNIDSMTPLCRWDRLGAIRSGDTLQLDAVYDPPAAESGVMGIMLIAVYPTTDLRGGSPPPPGANGPSDGGSSSSGGGMSGMNGMS